MTPINRDLSFLYQPFARSVEAFVSRWNGENPKHPVQVFEGFRPIERQAELYAQGRTAPGAKVTNAAPGFSWHNYGLAVDIVSDADPVKPGPQWSWDGKFPWQKLGRFGEVTFALEWAGSWVTFKEFPHFQKTWGMQIFEAHELLTRSGIQAVWSSLDLTRQVEGA